uniref:Uncharacterized protein n=1 Tax=Arundo donax TaxID=35708 RepID=A0A0A9EVZ1_ARUDO
MQPIRQHGNLTKRLQNDLKYACLPLEYQIISILSYHVLVFSFGHRSMSSCHIVPDVKKE